jgi:hypothetical protein
MRIKFNLLEIYKKSVYNFGHETSSEWNTWEFFS